MAKRFSVASYDNGILSVTTDEQPDEGRHSAWAFTQLRQKVKHRHDKNGGMRKGKPVHHFTKK